MSDIEHPRITEVGRLLAEIEYLRSAHVKACEALGDAEAEIERLREALEEAQDFISDHPFSGIILERAIIILTKTRAALAKEAGQ